MPMGMPAAGGAWGHDPFAGAKQAAAAYDQGAHYAVPGAGDVGEVPPPPPPPPMGGGGRRGVRAERGGCGRAAAAASPARVMM